MAAKIAESKRKGMITLTQWSITPSYKFDLACICNLFTGQKMYQEAHPQAWERFKHLFSEKQHNELAGILNQQGFLVSSALIAIFDSYEYNGDDIDEICRVAEDPRLRETALRQYFVDHNILNPEQWGQYGPMMPQLTSMARHIHQGGFLDYWKQNILPEIEQRCQEFSAKADKYPVVEEVNKLMGEKYALTNNTIAVYLCKFASPHGTSLAEQGFVSDIRWDLELTVAIALHEMMHPPFDRKALEKLAEELVQDEFVTEARNLLPPYYYPTARMFVEENIVEGAHIYLAEKLGVEKDPLQYFAKHDDGSHVLSVLLYDTLKSGIANSGLSLEEIVDNMMADGKMSPGTIRAEYMRIYEQAGLKEIVPF